MHNWNSFVRKLVEPRLHFALGLTLSLLGVVAKFWLVWQSEITDAADDSHEYVLQILHPIVGGIGYPPGTGWVGRLFYECGIPFRLGIEALFMFATALVLRVLLTWPHRSYLALGLFLFTIFDPNPTELFTHLMSDQVWTVETMLGLSCLVLALENEERPTLLYLLPAAFFLSLTTLTRSTFVPLTLCLLLFFTAALLAMSLQRRSSLGLKRRAVLFLSECVLLILIGAVYVGISHMNARVYGFTGVSALDCQEYKKFYLCLQSVGEPGDDPYFPVDEARRKLIAQAGPVSQQLMGQIEKDVRYKQVGIDHYGKADIPAGWFHFAAFNVVLAQTQGDFRQAYAIFASVEKEIDDAHREGRLEVRSILPLPDSRVSLVLKELPSGMNNAVRAMLYEPPVEALAWQGPAAYQSPEFTQAATRRVIEASPVRYGLWGVLGPVYACIYTWPLVLIGLGAIAAFVVVWIRLKEKPEFTLGFLAQQSFVIVFVGHFFWYAFFDASGLYVFTRYMLFQHVMLPVLIAYYGVAIWRLRGDPTQN